MYFSKTVFECDHPLPEQLCCWTKFPMEGPQELELQIGVSCQVDAGSQTQVLLKSKLTFLDGKLLYTQTFFRAIKCLEMVLSLN